MIDIMQQLANDPSVDSQFRRILAGKGVTRKMQSPHASSVTVLQHTAEILCQSDSQVELLQMAYDLGRIDGGLEATREALAKAQA